MGNCLMNKKFFKKQQSSDTNDTNNNEIVDRKTPKKIFNCCNKSDNSSNTNDDLMNDVKSNESNDKQQQQQSNMIEKSENIQNNDNKIIKILILGTGESGKSTLIKQMKIIHNNCYNSDEEMLEFRPIILDNLVSSMKYVVTGMKLLNIEYQYSINQELAKELILCNKYFNNDDYLLYPRIEYILKQLWQDNGVRKAVVYGFEYELNDSALYYFENIERITQKNFKPNKIDIIKSRIRTIGVNEIEFVFKNTKTSENKIIRMYDVGGQRQERRKWLNYFDDITTLIFVVAISEYDMTLIEDSNRNRLNESLLLFNNIINNLLFQHTTIILFLNKYDIFKQKIQYTDRQLKYYFSDYDGPDYDYECSSLFIEKKFKNIYNQRTIINNDHNNESSYKSKSLILHYTTATDTNNIINVFNSIINTILNDNICHSTLL